MNYAGKFDGAISSEGPGNHSHFAHLNPGHVHAPADAIVVPDAHFLFNADFKRSGVDLILSGDDREFVLHDYFKGEKHKALASPDGAHLTGALVDALTGHVEVAQAGGGPAAASAVIGHVTKLAGSATVIRNGVSIILNMGDNVEKGDVVQSGSNSTVGITFIDGTVFGLSSNAKMVLNEMVYDPNGSNNSSLLSLVSGTITFVAGETAKHGDMKIDTPVATMGIRGTAVLVEIDFSVPGQNGAPNASFQVLVEPDGTTGSYILFDKATMQPLAIINQAGQQININNGIISQTQNPLTPEMQHLITDVFNQAHADNTNTKTGSPVGSSTPDGTTATPKYVDNSTLPTTTQGPGNGQTNKSDSGSGPTGQGPTHVPLPPVVTAQTAFFVAEIPGKTNVSDLDQINFKVGFTDVNVGDRPTAAADFTSFTYKDVHGNDVTASLSALQQADIAATETALTLTPDSGNTNNGFVGVLYSLADKNFDFLAAGEELTLTYTITVNTNYGPDPEVTNVQVTFTIIGTNDTPVIATDHDIQLIHFAAGTATSGGTLVSADVTGGTYGFKDPDLTDTHWLIDANKDPSINSNANPADSTRFNSVQKASLTSASLDLPNGTTLDKAGLEALAPGPMSIFEQALDVSVSTDSTTTGDGVITWQLEKLPVFLADFIPLGETLKLTYTIEVIDEQRATDTKTVEVDITGTNAAATVWVHTTTDGHDNNWTTGANWGTGNAPTAANDVIIVTDQLHPNTPAYPATITQGTAAAAHSVVMNDFVAAPGQNIPPELKLETGSSLTISADFDLSADSILTNAGTVNVNGKLELLDDATNPVTPVNKSVITNSGTINIAQGGDIQGLANVTNSGTIELQGGTLNLDVNVANSIGVQGGNINVDLGAKLVLGTDTNPTPAANGGVTGGTVTINSGGELDLTGENNLSGVQLINNGQVNVTGSDNRLVSATVFNTGNASAIDVTGELFVAANSAIHNTTANSGETVESTGALTLSFASIHGGQVTVDGGGALNVDDSLSVGVAVSNAGTLTLYDAIIGSGSLTNTGQVNVGGVSSIGNETIFNTGTANAIDIAGSLSVGSSAITNTTAASGETIESGGTLTLQDASSITGGQVVNAGTLVLQNNGTLKGGALDNSGQLNVTGIGNTLDAETTTNSSAIDVVGLLTLDNGASIANAALSDTVTVEAAGSLILRDTTSISGGTVTNKGTLNLQGTAALKNGTLTNTKQVNVSGSGNTLDGETVSNTGTASAIDVTGTLALKNGTAVTNADSTSGEAVEGAGSLTLQDTSSISGGQVTNKGTLNLQGTSGLTSGTLANVKQVNVSGSANTLDHETVSNTGSAAVIDVTGSLTVKNGTTITNSSGGVETVEGTLTLQDTSSITAGTVTVGNTGKLNLQGTATLKNGTLTNGNLVNVTGTGNTLDHETVNNNATIDVAAAALLTLDNGTAITNGAAGNSETVEGTLTLQDTSSITAGTVTVSNTGKLNLQGTATLKNGTLTNGNQVNVTGTGNTLDHETVNNNATLDVAAAALLTLDNATAITNGAAGNAETVEGTLTLQDTSSITAGTVTVSNTGKLNLQGTATLKNGTLTNGNQVNVTGTGNTLDHETVNNNATLDVAAGALLTLDNGTSITNGATANAETVEGTLTLQDTSSITAGTVTISNTGKLNLQGTATLKNGTLTNGNQVNVTGTGNTLDHETVNNNAMIDVAASALLTLDNGTAITNGAAGNSETVEGTLTLQDTSSITAGTVTVSNTGKLNLQGTATLKNGTLTNGNQVNVTGTGNTLDHETVNNNATLDVAAAALLTLDNGTAVTNGTGNAETVEGTLTLQDTSSITAGAVTVSNTGKLNLQGTATLKNGTLTNGNQVNVTGTGNTLDHETVNNNATIDVAAAALLTLDNGTAVTNGTGNAETVEGTLTLQDTSSITAGTVTVSNTGKLNLQGTATLKNGTLTNGNQVNVTGTGNTLDHETVNNNATLDVAAGALLTLDNATAITNGAAGNAETVEGTLTLQDTSSITAGAVTVSNTGKLNLQGTATLKNGTLTNGNQVNVTGTGNTLDHETVNNNATIDVAAAALLTLDNGTAITNGATANAETVEGTLTLQDTSSITAGTVAVSNTGKLNLQGTATLKNGTLTNGNQVNVTGSGNTLDHETVNNNATLDVAAGALLTLDNGTAVTNGAAGNAETVEGTLTLQDTSSITAGTVTVGNTGKLNLQGTATLKNGTLTNGNQVNVTGTGNTLDHETVNNNATLDVAAAALLTLDNGTTITNGAAGNSETVEGTLTLQDTSSISGGAVANKSGGRLNLQDSSTVSGTAVNNAGMLTLSGTAALNGNGSLTNTGQVKVTGTNTLDHETVSNTGNASAIDITGALTVSTGTTITNTDANSGETVESGASLTLKDTSSIKDGQLVNLGTVTIEESSGATLDHVSVSGGGTMNVDANTSPPAALVLKGGTSITDGSIEVGSVGTLEVADGGATLKGVTIGITSGGVVQVDSDDTLALQGGSITGGKVTNDGAVDVDSGTLTLNGVTISGGHVTNAGTVDSTGGVTIKDVDIGNTGTIESTEGLLTIDGSVASGPPLTFTLTNSNMVEADGGQLYIIDEQVTNTGTLKAINDGTLQLTGLTVTNSVTDGQGQTHDGTVSTDGTSELDLSNATITGGQLNNAGALKLQGMSSLSSGSLANTGTLNVSGSGNALDDETVTANNMLEVLVGASLTLDQGTSIANESGTVQIDATATLTLNSASIDNGTVTNFGTIDSTGDGEIEYADITNTGTIESTVGILTIDGGSSGGSTPSQTFTLTNSNMVKADGGQLYIIDEQVANTGTLEAVNHGTLKLTGLTVTNTDPLGLHDGTVSTDGTSELDLSNATITGGTVINAGTIDSTGGGEIEYADITNTGTIESTVGILTIDGGSSGGSTPSQTFTLTNSNMVKADGGQLYIIDEQIANTGTLEAVNHGTLKLTGLTVTNTDPLGLHDGAVSVGSNSTLDLADAHISGGSLANAGTVYSTGVSTIDAAITNTHSIEVGSGMLTLSGSITGSGGSVTIDASATLDLASSFVDSHDVTFAGGGAELIIEGPAANGATSQNFTGDIHGFAATDEIDLRGISYGNPTYASYTYSPTTGMLSVYDGNGDHYDLDIGPGYAGAHFAGSDDTHGGTLITMTADDDLPAFGQTSLTASFDEQQSQTGSGVHDPIPPATASGTLNFTDVDLTDRPTVSIVTGSQSVTWTDTNGTTDLSGLLSDTQKTTLENALTLTANSSNHNNGATDWNYSIADSALDFLGEGQTLTITTTVVLDDHQNTTPLPTEQITVTIHGREDAPQITTATSDSFHEGDNTIDHAGGTISFTDVDLTDRSTVTAPFASYTYKAADGTTNLTLTDQQKADLETALTIVPDANNTNNGSATWSYDVADSKFDFLAQNETLTLTYTATVTDSQNVSVTQPITVTIHGTEDAPQITTATSDSFHEGDNTIDHAGGTISFTDVDLTDRSTVTAPFANYTYKAADGTTNLTLTDQQKADLETALTIVPDANNTNNGSATWSYDVADSKFDFLAQNETLTLTYTATVTDSQNVSVTQPITVTIHGTEDAPQITTATSDSFHEGDATIDHAGGTISFTDADLTDHSTVTAPFTSYTYKAADGTTNLTLTDAQKADLEAALTIVPDANNTNNGSATWSYDVADGKFDFLAQNETLTLTYTATVTDSQNVSVTRPITVTIHGTNDAPVIAYSGSTVSDSEDTLATISGLSVSDVDGRSSIEKITLSVDHGTISFDGQTGSSVTVSDTLANINTALANGVGYTPASYYSGIDGLHLSLDDQVPNAALTTTQDIAISVSPVADAPAVATQDASYSANANSVITLNGFTLLSDTDGSETLSLNLSSFPSGTTFNAGHLDQASGHWLISTADIAGLNGASLTMTPPADFGGTFSLHVDATVVDTATLQSGVVTDTKSFSNDFSVAVDKLTANDDSITDQPTFTENTDTTIATSVLLANDTDSLGNPIAITSVGDIDHHSANGGTVTLNGNVIDYTPATDFSGQDSFIYTISEGGQTKTATVTFNVAAPATSGSAAVTLGPADFSFDGNTYAVGPVATTNIGNGSDGVTLVGSVNWNGEGDAGHPQVIFYNGNTSVSGSGLFGEVTANGLDLQILAGGNAILDTGVTLASGQWHNVALTHENGTFTLYLDGAVAYTGDASANGIPNPSYPNEAENMFVAGDGGENFNGAVANVSVWNTALTQAQIQGTDFNALTGTESGLVAYYPLNDGNGTTVADTVNSAGNLQISGNADWTSPTGDTTLTIAPDNLQHQVFPFIQITGTAPTIHSATVTWNVNGSGVAISSEGLVGDSNGLIHGIKITNVGNSYQLTGDASVADYEFVLSHLTIQTPDLQSDGTTFTVTVNDGSGDSTAVTSTIHVELPSSDEIWTAGVDGDWNDGGNWSQNRAPVASDNVYINDPVTVTDDLGDSDQSITQLHLMSSGAELDIISSTDAHSFVITGDGTSATALQNAGLIDVDTFASGGTMVSATVSGNVENSGTIEADGPDATVTFGAVTVDNSNGTISSLDGGTFVFDGTTVSGGQISGDFSSMIEVGDSSFSAGVALTLQDGATVVDEIMTIASGDTLQIEHGSVGAGATLDDVSVTNSGTVQVDQADGGQPPPPVAVLTLEDGTIITGGTLSIGSVGTVDVEVGMEGQGGNNGYDFDAQLDHVNMTNGGIIEVDLNDDGAVLNLADGTSITGGTLNVGIGEVYVQSGFNGGVTLDHVTVTMDNSGEIEIGTAQSQGSTLVLEDGTTITGGTLSLDDTGDTVEILFGTNDIGATFDNVQVENSGTIQVGSAPIFGDPTLLLKDGTTISDGTLDIESTGVVNVQNGANGGATLNDVTVTNTGAITIGSGATLTLENDTCVNGAITFTGTGDTLALDSTTNAKNAVLSGFVSGNVVDFTDVTADEDASVGYSNGVLTLTYYAPGDTEHLHAFHESIKLSGGYSQSNFALQDDGHGGTEIVETGLVINQGVQTASVADGGNWYAAGQLTVSNPGTGDTWSITGGHNYASESYQYGIDEFNVVKTVGNTPTTVFDDSFDGTVPPDGPAIQAGSSPSGTSYFDFNSGIYAQGAGEALIEGSNAGWVGTSLGVNSYGDPVFGQFTTLLTGTSYNTTDPTDGLRSGQSFTVSGMFDLTTPPDNNTRYGIRLSDRVSTATSATDEQPGTEVVDLGVIRNGNNTASVLLGEYNYETGVSTNLQVATINVQPGDNEIQLSLSNDAANNGVVIASYTLFKSDGHGGEVADGTFTLGAVGHIFDNENWTRAQFYALATSTAPTSSTQTDSIVQGHYGQLDLAQDGTWHYQLNPGLPSVKALADGQHAQDDFQVQVKDASGAVSTQTISVTVTGVNDAPVATAPAELHATANTNFNLRAVGLSVSDADDGGKTETATLSAGEGVITIAAGDSGVTVVSGNGTGSVILSGTIAQINTLLSTHTGSGTVVYNDNAASPSSQTQLMLTIDDNGSNGGTALSDFATSTIDIASNGGSLNWNREVDPFAAATTATATKWVIPNADGLTSTVFNGGGFTYDPTTGLPTAGGVGSIVLVDNSNGAVLQSITNLSGVQLGDFGNFIAREQAIQSKIPWASLIETGENGPVSFSATDIRIANSDGTFTDIIGTNFAQAGDQNLTGSVTAVEKIAANGHDVLQTVNFDGGTSLSDLASAVFADNLNRHFYDLMAGGNTQVAGFQSSVAGGATSYFEIDDTPGNHAYTSPQLGTIGVNFKDATSGVTVNLAQGTADWGGNHDTLTNISFVFGSQFADTIVGNAFGGVLDGGGAQAGTQDTMTGSAGTTFMFQQGYGALTITNFDQAAGSFDSSEHDQLNFNGFSGNPNVHSDGQGNTIVDFGSGDVVTLLGVADASQIPQSDIFINGNNNGGGGNNGGGNNGGPVISNAGNSVTYAGTPVTLDSSIALTDTTANVSSVNVWVSSGFQTGDQLTIDGNVDGQITNPDGSIIHYHFDANANNNNDNTPAGGIFLSNIGTTPATTADFQAALELIQFSSGAADGNRTVTWAAYDGSQFSPTATTTVNIADNVALVAQSSFGGAGEHQGAAVTFADGHLYLSYNNGAQTQTTSDNADIVAFNTSPAGASQTFTYAWSHGDFFGIAADSTGIYAAGESYDLTTDGSGGKEAKSIFVSFDADGTPGSGPAPADGHTANNFFSYQGVEGFQNVLATTQGGNTILYALGSGQPQSFSGYIIAEYSSNGTLLHSATDSLASFSNPGGSGANAAVDWNGAIWVVGGSNHPSLGDTYGHATVWTASYDLSSVVMHEDNTGVPASFNGVATIGSALYAVGFANVASGESDFLVAKYNADGSVAWNASFGDGNGDTLNGAVALNGHLYVVGSETVSGGTEGVLMEIDPSNGSVISTTLYDAAQYNSLTSITTDGHYLYVAGVSGSSVSQDQAVLLTYDPGSVTIPDSGNLTVDGPSGETVVFDSGNGTLHLSQPSTFTGEIVGVSGPGDVLDMHGFHYGTTTATTVGGFDFATGTTTLTVHDSNGNLTETFKLAGDLSTSTWTVTDDHNGGVNIVDPPASSGQTLGPMIMNDPGQATSQVTIGHEGSSELAADSVASVTFDDATGHLVLDDASSSQIVVSGFTGDGTLAGSDQIDLKGIDYNSNTFSENYDETKGLLTITDGNKTATLQFNGTYLAANFKFVSDQHGGTIVYDPPVTNSDGQHATSVGGDCFAFNLPGLQPLIQHAFEEFHDVLAPLKDVLHLTGDANLQSILGGIGASAPAGTPPQTSISVDLSAWHDSLKPLLPHADLHV